MNGIKCHAYVFHNQAFIFERIIFCVNLKFPFKVNIN